MTRKTFQPTQLFSSKPWGFSQAVSSPSGRIVHIAGQVAWGANGQIIAKDLEGQFRQVLKHIQIAVEAAGGTKDDIQMLRIYIPNFKAGSDADLIASVLTEVFGIENPPASTWVGVQSLAQPEYLVEVDGVAVVVE